VTIFAAWENLESQDHQFAILVVSVVYLSAGNVMLVAKSFVFSR
jgi:hypothetical protein